MATKNSIKAFVRDAKREDSKARKGAPLVSGLTADSFVNFAHKLGVGADNALTSGTYGFNPITRNRTLLEWIHRGSWLGGVAVDIIADDMTRAGVDFLCEMEPEDSETIARKVVSLNLWPSINEVIKWARLYGGGIGAMLIDGQDPKTPLRLETVGKDQFKGLLVLDRWMVDPSLGDLCTEYGPDLGLPNYYTVQANSPALRGQVIHRSRLAFRLVGVELPYQQRLTENLWGISVLERLYDRMIAFDSASTGAAQLVFKSHLRTMRIDGLREIVASGGDLLNGLQQYMDMMRRFQGIEGITMMDLKDEFEVQSTSAFSGVESVINALAMQLSGALQMPLVRLFGQSPGGLGSNGDSEVRTYYDHINQKQNKELMTGVTTLYRCVSQSEGIKPPDNFALDFRSLWELDDKEKADIAQVTTTAVTAAKDAGLIGAQTSMRELRQSSRVTGVFTNITQDAIDAADDEVMPPDAEQVLGHEQDLEMKDKEHEHSLESAEHGHELGKEAAEHKAKLEAKNAGPQGAKRKVADGARRRVSLQQ